MRSMHRQCSSFVSNAAVCHVHALHWNVTNCSVLISLLATVPYADGKVMAKKKRTVLVLTQKIFQDRIFGHNSGHEHGVGVVMLEQRK
jgi:hypothetical protein